MLFAEVFSCSTYTLAETITDPEPPVISIARENIEPELLISNFSYSYIYEITVTNINNPSEITAYTPITDSTGLNLLGIRSYGDYLITVHIKDTEGNIIASSQAVTYSNHIVLQEATATEQTFPTLYAAGMVRGTGYSVYRSAGNASAMVKIGDYTFDSDNEFYDEYYNPSVIFVDKYAVPGVTYYYQIQAYETDNNGITYYDTPSNIVTGIAVSGIAASDNTATDSRISSVTTASGALKISWDDDSFSFYNKTYSIYKARKGDTSFVKVKTIKNTYSHEWTDKDVTIGSTYYYMIVCGEGSGSEVIPATEILCTLGQTTITHKTSTPTNMKISWKKVAKAEGYIVYLRKPGKTEFKYFKKIKGNKRTFNLKVSNGKQYGIKIIAYGTVNGLKLTGSESVYEPYGDYYAYANESYESKSNRVYKGFKQSSSWSVIDKRMTTIAVKVWDFKSGMSGAKVTKTKYITCHKRLAPTLKKIFSEIYKGKEKAPIYEAGCYSRRSGEHGNGMAVDLNSNYNAMFDNGKPTAGSYWNPKKYAYSIKRHGDIENAFEKYGFTRGFWGSRKDYMHFSYFGT